MATAYSSPCAKAKFPARSGDASAGLLTVLYDVSGSVSTWASGDTIAFGTLPKGAVVTGVQLQANSQLDSNASPTLAFEVGYSGTAAAFGTTSSVGHAAGVSYADLGNGRLTPLAADTAIVVQVSTAAATAVAGTLSLAVTYFVEPAAASNP